MAGTEIRLDALFRFRKFAVARTQLLQAFDIRRKPVRRFDETVFLAVLVRQYKGAIPFSAPRGACR